MINKYNYIIIIPVCAFMHAYKGLLRLKTIKANRKDKIKL